jgi:hypothetical protein
MASFIYPTGAELDVIAQTKTPRLIAQSSHIRYSPHRDQR